MKTILVAVDGSEPARHALNQAAGLAREMNAQLHLAYAVALNPIPFEVSPHGVAELLANHRAFGNLVVEQARDQLPSDMKAAAVTHVRDGSPDEVINALAKELSADVVVVGNTGRGAAGRFLLGSTADRLIHTCKRPLLVVR